MRKSAFVLALLASGALAGCDLSSVKNTIDGAVVTNLPKVCDLGETMHTTFVAVAANQAAVGRPLASSVIANEQLAHTNLTILCTNPTDVSSSAIIAKGLGFYVTITQALSQAKRVEAAR